MPLPARYNVDTDISTEIKDFLVIAEREARDLRCFTTSAEHIVLAILTTRKGPAYKVLCNHNPNITVASARSFLTDLGPAGEVVIDNEKYTPSVTRVLTKAVEIAISESENPGTTRYDATGHAHTWHLLAGLLTEPDDRTVALLEHLDIDPEAVLVELGK